MGSSTAAPTHKASRFRVLLWWQLSRVAAFSAVDADELVPHAAQRASRRLIRRFSANRAVILDRQAADRRGQSDHVQNKPLASAFAVTLEELREGAG